LHHESLQHLPIEVLRLEKQVRMPTDAASLLPLVTSIREHGILIPVLVADEQGTFRLLDGHRRVSAAREIGLLTVPAVVRAGALDPAQVLTIQLTTAWQRADLSPVERALAVAELMTLTGLSAGKVAAKLGVSAATVCRHLRLLKLPSAIQQHVATGRVAASAGYHLASVSDASIQDGLAAQVAAGELTRDGLVRKTKERPGGRSRRERPTRIALPLGGRRSIVVFGPAVTIDSLVTWLEECLGRVRDARSRGVVLGELRKELVAQVKRA
jgi:ParB family transcriptional regulator, chromosome partitioning protein